MKSISFALFLLLSIATGAAEELFKYNYESLVSDFAFDDYLVSQSPFNVIEDYKLNTNDIIPILFKICNEIESGNFKSDFGAMEYDEERVISVTYMWLADLVHSKKVTDMVKAKYNSYDINDRTKRYYIYSMLATLEGDKFAEFVRDVMVSHQYPNQFKITTFRSCKSIYKLYPQKQAVINDIFTELVENKVNHYNYEMFDYAFSYINTNYAYSSKRKEKMRNVIKAFSKSNIRSRDVEILDKRLSELIQKERVEWWRKNKRWCVFVVVLVIGTGVAIGWNVRRAHKKD